MAPAQLGTRVSPKDSQHGLSSELRVGVSYCASGFVKMTICLLPVVDLLTSMRLVELGRLDQL